MRARSDIKASLAARARALLDASAASGEPPPAGAMEALERDARLLELAETGSSDTRRPLWLAALLVGTTVAILSVLLFVRVPQTDIEADLRVSDIEFVTAGPQLLMDLTHLDVLGVSGLRGLDLPDSFGERPAAPSTHAVRLEAMSDGTRTGSVTLAPVLLPAGTRVGLHHTAPGLGYRLDLQHPDLALGVSVQGPVRVGLATSPSRSTDDALPWSLKLEPSQNELVLDLDLDDGMPARLSPRLSVNQLILSRMDEFVEPDVSIVERVPTILSGTLFFESLNGRQYPLRAGQVLRLGSVRGEIGGAALGGEGVVMYFRGAVRGLQTGWSGSQRSLMPTMLDWLQARHGLSLLWASTLYVLGLAFALLRWWGVQV